MHFQARGSFSDFEYSLKSFGFGETLYQILFPDNKHLK